MALPTLSTYAVGAGQPIHGGRWPGGRLTGTASLSPVVASGSLGAQVSQLSGNAALGAVVASGGLEYNPTFTLRQVEADGIITPGSFPSAWYRNGALYHGWVDDGGNSGVTKYTRATNTQERAILSATTQYNSHNNCVVDWTSDGRLIALWSKHNSGEYVRRRVATSSESVSAFGAEANTGTPSGASSYVNLWRLSQTGRLYAATRAGGSNPRPQQVNSSADGTTWDAFRTWISDPTHRPYPRYLSDGVSRVHMLFTTGNPSEVSTQLHYAYMQLDGSNVERFYRMDGTELGGPATPANSTLAVSNADGRVWVYDLTFGPDGELWALYYRFPTTSDQRLMFVKTTGGRTGWGTPVEIATAGSPLYAAEAYSHAGAVFDSENPTTIWACLRNGNPRHEVYKYTTANNGGSWTQAEQCTSGSTNDNFQIVSPLDHGGDLPWIACTGTYTNWDAGYSTQIRGWVRD